MLQNVDYIIALTHMRWPNDTRLAENVADIDLILGGHDHDFIVRKVRWSIDLPLPPLPLHHIHLPLSLPLTSTSTSSDIDLILWGT